MSILSKLKRVQVETCEPTWVYSLDEIKAKGWEMVDLGGNNWLAVALEGLGVEYAFFSFHCADQNMANVQVECIWEGQGTGDGLREMRHTYFMPDDEETPGYVFYLPIDATIKALQHLKKYFDD